MNDFLKLGDEVATSLRDSLPVVALESAVLTHGLPAPRHLEALTRMENAVRASGAVPATCLAHDGRLWVGASQALAEHVSAAAQREKASVRDLGRVLALHISAGLTVSATLFAAQLAGIRVFATGGIGGVHIGAVESGDISADLFQLGRSPLVTVCSGAKSVLDIPRTLEFLETAGVPVFAYRSDEFPAFYLTGSGSPSQRVDSASEIARIATAQWELGYRAGVVVGHPIPPFAAILAEDWDVWLTAATALASEHHVSGKDVTPFLLSEVASLSAGRTVDANLVLLESNARLAGEIAGALLS